ncbi:hypothetical protein GA0070624_3221 [Micromonospora rhizosphaerae]|uniref:Uncharacterized protein n=1 Tax=Micromonospora rhizosphaerae TaxID=568872 RepID=A0A1C6S965_9ACTN|nr:hypothetical protein [Micromonospora rhizosphaerae]SCL26020.1 hypothetical protein GA0070624_3221 [Micromonospora rhizosphaerae]
MVNWVTRRDLSEAAKGGVGFFALLMLVMAALFAGRLVVGVWTAADR